MSAWLHDEAAAIARAEELYEEVAQRYFAPPPHVDTAEWAGKYRYIAKGPERGQWRNERTPYLVEPMYCASSFSPFERVVLMFATQLGKTEVLYNALLQRIHTDPQDMMMVQPTLHDAKDHSNQRFLPTVKQTPILDGLVTVHRSREEASSWRTRSIQGGFAVFFSGANSASSIASKPLGFAAADEVDKWPHDVDNQGPPLGLLDERMSNFGGRRKLLVSSTPTIRDASVIETEYQLSDRRRYFVPCPHCDHLQVLVWGTDKPYGLKWLKTEAGEARAETAVYVCCNPECGGVIQHFQKTELLANGKWIADAPGASRGLRAGFQLNKLYSPVGWASWARLVEKFDAAQKAQKTGDSKPMKEFKNSSMAETYKEEGTGADAETLRQRAEAYPRGIVPMRGLMLTMGVDTQPDRLEARVWAFGRGEESWLVEAHIIFGDPNIDEGAEGSPWTRLTEIRRTPVQHAGGAQIVIEATAVDSGGHNTHAVYTYCRNHSHSNVLAIKGASENGKPVLGKAKPMDVNWRGKSIARGVKLWMIGTDTAKHLLYGRMRLTATGPGFVHVPEALKRTDEFEQMTAARLVPVTVAGKQTLQWRTPQGKREEAGDCMVYAYAAACFLGIQTYRDNSWERRALRIAPVERDLFSAPPPVQVDTPPATDQPAAAPPPAPAPARPAATAKPVPPPPSSFASSDWSSRL